MSASSDKTRKSRATRRATQPSRRATQSSHKLRYSLTKKPSGTKKRVKVVRGIRVVYWPSTRGDKKWMTVSPKGHVVHWGHPTMKDFTQHHSLKRRKNYRSRHAGILLKDGSRAIDKTWSPAWLSYYVTW